MSTNLNTSIQYLKSVGPKRAEAFNKIGINTYKDLLFYFPSKHLDRTTILNSEKIIEHVVNGFDGELTIVGKVVNKEIIRYGRKQLLKVQMRDSRGFFECVWFQGIKYFKNRFTVDEKYAVSAKPVLTKYGNLQFAHPDFDYIDKSEYAEFQNTGKIIPFYKLPKELKSKNIGDYGLRRIISNAVAECTDKLAETLPKSVIERQKIDEINSAVRNYHFPKSKEELEKAKERFKFEEFFYLELLLAHRKYSIKRNIKGNSLKVKSKLVHKFLEEIPFELTKAQLNVLHEIRNDMEKFEPMNRLVQGDVGSGKTIVAVISMLIAIDSGYEAALMVPTEILAKQHFNNISKLLDRLNIKIGLLIGGQTKKEKQKNLKLIASGEIDIIIGTHAMFQDTVEFNKVGLVIIDEQHRFGVEQRSKLIGKSKMPDVLIMTATPIPRTLSMSAYSDLDLSVIDELPGNRKPIQTFLRGDSKLPKIYEFILDKSKEGYQSYIVYPLVDESDKIDIKAAEKYYEELKENHLKDLRIGLIHGKMKWEEKESVMKSFLEKDFDVLISTTVIEVGIDVPDANIILINNAERFGLSQLHQLRGRVGRGDKQAYCILATDDKIINKSNDDNWEFEFMSSSQIEENKTLIRLKSLVNNSSGFDLAEIDLKLRGPGNIFGTEQSGLPKLKFGNIIEDQMLLKKAKEEAFNLIENDFKFANNENKIVLQKLKTEYKNSLKFYDTA